MVIQKTLDNLKEKPKEDKKAIAGGIALALVVILFFGWAFFFFKKIQRNTDSLQLGGGAQDEFNFSNVRDAQEELMQGFSDLDELRSARQETGSQYQEGATQGYSDPSADPFGGE